MRHAKTLLALAMTGAMMAAIASPAEARTCTRLGFSVNDYGKEGPTRDAKRLLDKYIASWTKENGIKRYRTGRKKVTCELFLDLIVFDEHTCKASASVCWNGPPYKVKKDRPS
ncbi:MAG: hypothetical protein AAFV26_04140 [Pseudomonadota bacterium]